MVLNEVVSGYLDVKISARSRRGFTPWKAWQKQWCEIKKLDSIENGVELKLKSSEDGGLLRTLVLPRSSTICRTESRTKQFAFGVFTLGRSQKPLLFLSGSSEHVTQQWIASIRRMLSVASYLPIGEANFHVSLVDNVHSRAAGMYGLFGVLGTNSQEIIVSDPCTGETKVAWKWFQFHQFHLQAPSLPDDEGRICVMHTSGDFPSGPGHLYLYCNKGSKLLNRLIARGKPSYSNPGFISSKRLSCSEGDLCDLHPKDVPDSPLWLRSQTGSDDSGVRVSLASEDTVFIPRNKKNTASLSNLGFALLTTTPGGSETNESTQDLSNLESSNSNLPRRESGISIASGIYEEIEEGDRTIPNPKTDHIYENLLDVILKDDLKFKPPPLPPRFKTKTTEMYSPFKHRCNTLPAKDLSRISQIFTSESEYMIMTLKDRKKETSEALYVPMSPIVSNIKSKIESCYMAMSGKNK